MQNGFAQSGGNIDTLLKKAADISVENVELSGKYCESALDLAKKNNDSLKIALSKHCLSRYYLTIGDVDKSVELINEAIPVFEQNEARFDLANAYSLKSIMVGRLNEYDKAIDFLNKAIVIFDELHDKHGLAKCYINLGVEYIRLKRYEEAIDVLKKSDQLSSEIGYKENSFYVNLNLGNAYLKTDQYEKAKTYLFKALEIARTFKMKDSEVSALNIIGNLYMQTNNKELALEYYTECKNMALMYHLPMELSEVMLDLSNFYKKQKDYQTAMTHYEEYIALKDSMYRIDKLNKITELEKKLELREKEIIIHQKNSEIQNAQLETKHEKNIKYIIMATSAVMLLFVIFLFKSNRDKKIMNIRLEHQKKETDQKNVELNNRTEEIEAQRDLIHQQKEKIEQKNKDMMDSIIYANKIQNTILPDINVLGHYFSGKFVVYMPKDIVSGDLFWIYPNEKGIYFSVIDCTGHGIPGAFMSIVAYNSLNSILKENKNLPPGEILNSLNQQVILSLNKHKADGKHVRDGMDMVLCYFDEKSRELTASCANTSLYIVRNNNIIEENNIRTHRLNKGYINELMPHGDMIGSIDGTNNYKQSKIQLEQGDRLFLFSDGYPDQFGGKKGKKLNYKQFRSLLGDSDTRPFEGQKEEIITFFNNWKGKEEQLDDICILGLEV